MKITTIDQTITGGNFQDVDYNEICKIGDKNARIKIHLDGYYAVQGRMILEIHDGEQYHNLVALDPKEYAEFQKKGSHTREFDTTKFVCLQLRNKLIDIAKKLLKKPAVKDKYKELCSLVTKIIGNDGFKDLTPENHAALKNHLA